MMEDVSAEAYAELIRSCRVLEKDGHGEKVLLNDDGQIIKIFRRKRLLSSALFYPYARRFAANAKRLLQRDIPTVIVTKLGRCRQPKRDLVWYQLLAGETLREYCQQHDPEAMISSLGVFVATLHQRGVLFRSLHWGNVIVQPDLSLGLIDIADLRFYRRPLSVEQRARNFRHMLRYRADRELFDLHADTFWTAYSDASNLPEADCLQLRQKLPVENGI
ncbi:MAG: hypothetical protein J7K75_13400 [Desulfuromonas sp.]|nr:hypothetical protein [Desulfuromonas sp.]